MKKPSAPEWRLGSGSELCLHHYLAEFDLHYNNRAKLGVNATDQADW